MNTKCDVCKTGSMKRSHTCEDYVIWTCDAPGCDNQDLEFFGDMDDEGWLWLREYYKQP